MKKLEIDSVTVKYGAITALEDISFSVKQGQVCAVIGANGAGKSTLMKAISGLLQITSGAIRVDGQTIHTREAEQRVTKGVALSPEGRRLFPELSVQENLMMGAYRRKDKSALAADLEQVYAYFPRLKERISSQGRHLSGGEQQMCAIGRAMMSRPSLLLLDEPSLGLAPAVTLEVAKAIRAISETGTTIVLVEQNARLALRLSDWAVVLETGKLVLEGKSVDVMADPKVESAYLGQVNQGAGHA